MRSGTLNVPGIVGLGRACAICRAEMADESARLARLRDRLLDGLQSTVPAASSSTDRWTHRLPNNLHVSVRRRRRRVAADRHRRHRRVVRFGLRLGVRGSPSHVLRAILGDRRALGVDSLRPRPLHDRRGHRLHDREIRDGGRALAEWHWRSLTAMRQWASTGACCSRRRGSGWTRHRTRLIARAALRRRQQNKCLYCPIASLPHCRIN